MIFQDESRGSVGGGRSERDGGRALHHFPPSFTRSHLVFAMTITAAVSNPSEKAQLTPEDVPLREGPPTREELLVHYPAKFTWTQMKAFVNSG